MNIIEESFQTKEQKNKKKWSKIILIAIILVFLIMVSIMSYLAYVQSKILRVSMDGVTNENLKQLLVFEQDGTIYVPIKETASFFGYESYNGEYTEKSESQNKCYIQSKNEIVNFTLGSKTIYKLDLTQSKADYETVELKNPIKAINGVLYMTTEGVQKAFNSSFTYDQEKNRIEIYTLPYLAKFYQPYVLDYGYSEMSEVFADQKAMLDNMLIVKKDGIQSGKGVITTGGDILIEPKYEDITYIPSIGDFMVKSNGKVGIMSKTGTTKVEIIYDEIISMGSDVGLYVVKVEGKYGVIDTNGVKKMYNEYDEIGIDTSKFSKNNIKSKYLLADNLIPVKKDDLWGLFNTNGEQVVDFKYDSFGYIASNNKDAYNLLMIPNYNVLVACKDNKYALLSPSGEELFGTIADDIYMTISGGKKHYYVGVNDQVMDAEQYLDKKGVQTISNN